MARPPADGGFGATSTGGSRYSKNAIAFIVSLFLLAFIVHARDFSAGGSHPAAFDSLPIPTQLLSLRSAGAANEGAKTKGEVASQSAAPASASASRTAAATSPAAKSASSSVSAAASASKTAAATSPSTHENDGTSSGGTSQSERESISVVIPTYRRASFLLRQLPYYLKHPRIDDVVVSDDYNSTDAADVRKWVAEEAPKQGITPAQLAKLRVISTPRRLQCMRNKVFSLSNAKNDWVAVLDSDNFFGDDFFSPLFSYWGHLERKLGAPIPATISFQAGYNSLITTPWGMEMFDFRRIVRACGGDNAISDASWSRFYLECGSAPLVATFNAVYNKRTGMRACSWLLDEGSAVIDPFAYDSIVLNWLYVRQAGGSMHIVGNMTYDHTQHGNNLASEYGKQTSDWFDGHKNMFMSADKAAALAYLATGGYKPQQRRRR